MDKFLKAFYTNHVLSTLMFFLVLVLGIAAYLTLPREQDPQVNFNWIQITTLFPNASALDVERQVTDKLENALHNLSDVRFVSSNSREGISSILVRFNDLEERVFDKRVNDLRRELQNKSRELPQHLDNPEVMEVTTANAFPTATLLVTSNAHDDNLRKNAENIKNDIEQLKGVDQVIELGLQKPELQLHFDPNRLADYGITAPDLSNTILAHFKDISAGALSVDKHRWLIRWEGKTVNPNYIAEIPVMTAKGELRLGDIAEVQRGREDPKQLVHFNGQPAIMLSVNKKSGANILDLVTRLKEYLVERNKTQDATGVKLVLIDDQTTITREALGIMQSNALFGLCLVFFTTWLFLGLRMSVLVSIGIPFTLAGIFLILYAMGQTLNVSVLLAVVIALGMLVDDAVVVVESIYNRIRRGARTIEACLDGLKEVFAPVTTSVLTTVSAFLPLMLLPGILGKFMFVIPLVVTLGLCISLVEAFWMLPSHIIALKPKLDSKSKVQFLRDKYTHAIKIFYIKKLIQIMRHPKKTFGVVVFLILFSFAAVLTGFVKFNFFASDPIRLFYVNVEMPPGTKLDETLRQSQQIEYVIRDHLEKNEVRAVTTYSGLMFTEIAPFIGKQYGQVMVSLRPQRSHMRSVDEVISSMREDVIAVPGPLHISFLKLTNGPPISKPINVKVRGSDYQEIRQAADVLKDDMKQSIPTISDISDDDSGNTNMMIMQPNFDAIHRAGLNPGDIARMIRIIVSGEIVSTLTENNNDIYVRVRGKPKDFDSIRDILRVSIALPIGGEILLGDLVNAKTLKGRSNIRHYNFRRAITVEADLDTKEVNTVQANEIIKASWKIRQHDYPGVSLEFSGQLDDIQESMDAIPILFLLGIGLIYLLLGTQFRSYWQPLMILVSVPMAFTGVVFGLIATRNPMSLYTLYGVVALAGISVNAAIVLISAANERLRQGMTVLHATLFAARRRVIPILITSLTTIAGLFSLATGLGGKSLLWGPVATAIVWGLAVSTVLTLFVIPLLYHISMRKVR